MDKDESRPDYVSYLLRVWREGGTGASLGTEEGPIWRASVVSTLTGRRQGFASLDDLFDFLRRQARAAVDSGPERHPAGKSHVAPDAADP